MSVVENALQRTLVDLIDLSLAAKQLHWNIYGPNFRSLHLQLDEVVEVARTAYDQVAERLVTIGGVADGRATTVSKDSNLAEVADGRIHTDEGYEVIVKAINDLVAKVKSDLTEVDEADPLTGDLLIGLAQDLEEQAWLLRSQVAKS